MMWDDPVLPVRGEHYCPDHPDVAVHWFKYPNGDVEYLCGMRLPRADVAPCEWFVLVPGP